MFAELIEVLGTIRNPYLKALLDALFADDEIARRIRVAPAAKGIHHAYLGGLIENVPDPEVNLAGLNAQFIGQVGNRLLAAQMPAHNIRFLLGGKRSTSIGHGTSPG